MKGNPVSQTLIFTEGAKFWFVPSDPRYVDRSREVTVTRVGRKWAVLDDKMRADLTTGQVDGGNYTSPGCVWPSEGVWRETRRRAEVWRAISRTTAYGAPPSGVSLGELEAIYAKLVEAPSLPQPNPPKGS